MDLVFSFDSLVHVDEDTMRAYVSEIARKLKPEGAAFIHHSNLGEHRTYLRARSIAPLLVAALDKLGVIEDLRNQWRDPTMSAASMCSLAAASGLRCVSQELITWSTRRTLIECISVLVHRESSVSRDERTRRNPGFMNEAKYLSELSRLYDMGAGPAGSATRP